MSLNKAASEWFSKLKAAKKTFLIQDERRKIHFLFSDGTEMCEEYDLESGLLLVRKWHQRSDLGRSDKWEYEVGQSAAPRAPTDLLSESLSNPLFGRKDTAADFQWRIRNLPYPIDNYLVTVDDDSAGITVRTVNKKYYKKFTIPDMQRCQLPLERKSLSIAHASNTLIITYKKPSVILQLESTLNEAYSKARASKDGDVDCTPS
ncbi:protein DPCD-like [Dysidea avara]|uniref:protein DPCD-like n=1 Tax=Dysidea avara TaxID=196820 RepID=UPI00332C3F1F